MRGERYRLCFVIHSTCLLRKMYFFPRIYSFCTQQRKTSLPSSSVWAQCRSSPRAPGMVQQTVTAACRWPVTIDAKRLKGFLKFHGNILFPSGATEQFYGSENSIKMQRRPLRMMTWVWSGLQSQGSQAAPCHHLYENEGTQYIKSSLEHSSSLWAAVLPSTSYCFLLANISVTKTLLIHTPNEWLVTKMLLFACKHLCWLLFLGARRPLSSRQAAGTGDQPHRWPRLQGNMHEGRHEQSALHLRNTCKQRSSSAKRNQLQQTTQRDQRNMYRGGNPFLHTILFPFPLFFRCNYMWQSPKQRISEASLPLFSQVFQKLHLFFSP